jgi:hypothetical protein
MAVDRAITAYTAHSQRGNGHTNDLFLGCLFRRVDQDGNKIEAPRGETRSRTSAGRGYPRTLAVAHLSMLSATYCS